MDSATANLRTSDQAVRREASGDIERTGAAAGNRRLARWWRGHPEDPTWARPSVFGLLLATGILYFYNLTASGWANSFYSAAAQAGSVNWEAFFFGSSDAANSITVDKPPAALWVMALSIRIFGLNSFALLMPEVLMGVATVGLVHSMVRRQFGAGAGLLSGAVLALTPVAALMFRFNNPDALLVLLMTLGAWATMRAIEKGSIRWMALVGVFLGFGFLTKTFQVFLVIPFFGIAYLVAAKTNLKRRVLGLIAGLGAMVIAAGWWVFIVELVPAGSRPYIGGSQTNSFWDLTFGYNGFGRLSGNETGSVGGGGGPAGGTGGGMWGVTGITRMFGSEVGSQVSWLLPTALILLGVGIALRGRKPRTDGRRAAYLVWGGWLLVTGLTFSFMAGIFHQYYTVALAPAIAAVVGMGAKEAWDRRHHAIGSITLAAATAAAATWSFILLTRVTAYDDWLRASVLAVGMAAAFLLLALNWLHRKAIPLVLTAAIGSGLAGPAAYTWSTVNSAHTGSIPTAGPAGMGGMGGGGGAPGGGMGGTAPGGGMGGTAPGGTAGAMRAPGGTTGGTGTPGGTTGGPPTGKAATTQRQAGGMGGLLDASTPSTAIVSALQSGANNYTWVAAAIGSNNAAGLQLATGQPVMPIGGFNGSDPSPTLAQFKSYVQSGRIHYFVAGGIGGGGRSGGSNAAQQITTWVEAHYTKVTIGGSTFYDLTQPTDSSSASTN
ncbi:MAG TPA: glycosyltransferase family 39 protein [Flexivirga sp.]|uniref:ArnT family glycosyltransferase n=1 Tax=Flexivirga sp. TaxID=1962927 RepID=UPI002C244D5E|nr:glycosyltransferase family 39 protein [Flexivirga sp.]HWC21215.1 glycosyltransferase family 39 protein [Flexivirga sp.]